MRERRELGLGIQTVMLVMAAVAAEIRGSPCGVAGWRSGCVLSDDGDGGEAVSQRLSLSASARRGEHGLTRNDFVLGWAL